MTAASELWTSAQAAAVDRHSIDTVGIPSAVLMERAALACSHEVVALRQGSALPVVVVCGAGNNGADGMAIARQLAGWGVPVRAVAVVDGGGDGFVAQRSLARACGVVETALADVGDRALVVDACLGTGSRGAPRGAIAAALAELVRIAGPRLAVDVPSGVDPDRGTVAEHAVTATVTVTFGRSKPGLHLSPGCVHAGRIVVADIGLVPVPTTARRWSLADLDAVAQLAAMPADVAHKGDRGHVAVRAGGDTTPGAAVLSTRAAFRSGAGLVTLVSDAAVVRAAIASAVPETMLAATSQWRAHRHDAAIVGPGLTDADDLASLPAAWRDDPRPAVWDATALSAIDGRCGAAARVVTPHPGEAARLLSRLRAPAGDGEWSAARVQADRVDAAERIASLTGATVLLKGRATIVVDAERTAIVPLGGPGLATAGSGDVLAGIIGALMARGAAAFDAAIAGATWHAAAGDLAAARWAGTRALDLVDALPEALRGLATRAAAYPQRRRA